MKVLVYNSDQQAQDYLTKNLPGAELSFSNEALTPGTQVQQTDAEVISCTVQSKLSADVLAKFPNLKMIAARSTGLDHIDQDYCKAHNIQVSSVPTYGEHTVAEFAFGLMLSLTRKIPQAVNQVKQNYSEAQTDFQGMDLVGKTLGVVGTGKIGMHVIKIALGFEMKVLASDPYPKTEEATQMGFQYVSLDDLLVQSDIITIHCPATPETEHLLNAQNLPKTKKGVLIINDARGAVIETQALLDNLKSGQLGGAALDVLESEAQVTDVEKELIALPNVLVTPHIAFDTVEAVERILQTTAENIQKLS